MHNLTAHHLTISYQVRLIPSLGFPCRHARPPVEEGAGVDGLGLLHEGEAALADRVVEILDGLEVAVDERFEVGTPFHGPTPPRTGSILVNLAAPITLVIPGLVPGIQGATNSLRH
jgi:hypothetical protein